MIDYLRQNFSDIDNNDFFSGTFVSCDQFLSPWEAAKSTILTNIFNENLIIRKPINITIANDSLIWAIRDKIFDNSELMNDFIDAFENVCNTTYIRNITYGGFKYSLSDIFINFIFDCEAWVDNYYDGPTVEINFSNGNTYKLVHGCKVIKALGRLVKYINDPKLTEVFEHKRLIQSQIMNDSRIRGNLCLSIHPLDYMTASYNSNDWRSCMCWEDGEYRRGVIEMMNSPYVVVAYLESNTESLPIGREYSWNSKKWREFFIVRPELISGIKGYPYWNRTLEDEVLIWLRKLYAPNSTSEINYWHYGESCTTTNNGKTVNTTLRFDCGPAMYNDFYADNVYHTILLADDYPSIFWTHYSGISECVCCGCEGDFDGEGELICQECVTHYICCECGDIIYSDSDIVNYHGNYYCRYCFDDLNECINCGAKVDTDTMGNEIDGVLTSDENINNIIKDSFDQDIFFTFCPDCAERFFKDGINSIKYFNKRSNNWWFDRIGSVPINKVTDLGLKFFHKNFDF